MATFHFENGVLSSSEGYSVRSLGRDEMLYTEGDRSLRIWTDPGAKGWIIEFHHLRWDSPHGDELIDDAKADEIFTRIKAAMAYWGSRCEFHFEDGSSELFCPELVPVNRSGRALAVQQCMRCGSRWQSSQCEVSPDGLYGPDLFCPACGGLTDVIATRRGVFVTALVTLALASLLLVIILTARWLTVGAIHGLR